MFQAVMQDLLGGLEFTHAYQDDILITSRGTVEDHMAKMTSSP
jgi:hypothetical protein